MGNDVEVCAPRLLTTESASRALVRRAFILFRAILLLGRYKVLYMRSHPLALPLICIARVSGRAVFVEVNGTYEDVLHAYPAFQPLRFLFDLGETAALRLCTGAFAVTEPLCEYVRARAKGCRVAYVPNAAGPAVLRGGHSQETADAAATYVLFFGALARWQGLEVLGNAIRCTEWPTEVRLIIAGDGAQKRYVQALAGDNPGKVEYVGRVSKSTLAGLIQGALCTLSVQDDIGGRSRFGLEPLKVYESLVYGTPVVVSDWPGQADLIRRAGCGVVVAPGSAVAVANAVQEMFSRREYWHRERARISLMAQTHHTWANRAEETLHGITRQA